MSGPIIDHAGKPVEHGRARVNGVLVALDVRGLVLPRGHQLAEECPRELAQAYLAFFAA